MIVLIITLGIKQTFNKKQAYCRSAFLHAKLLNQKDYICFCFSLYSATTWKKNQIIHLGEKYVEVHIEIDTPFAHLFADKLISLCVTFKD